MLLQIGARPESDFSEPLGMLSDCHKRIQFFLRDLLRLAEGSETTPLDATQRLALERALRYFQESGPRHTADEEESLFPRLRAKKDDRLVSAFAKILELQADHLRAEQSHEAVDDIGRRWLAEGVLSPEDSALIKRHMAGLHGLYEHHLAVEDNEIFPIAAALLSAGDKTEMGREMATRRGLSATIVKTA